MSVGPRHENEKTKEDFLLSVALRSLAKDAIHRSRTVCRRVGASPIWLLALTPPVSAMSDPLRYPANTTDPTTESDVESLVGMFSWREWSAQADAIRIGANRRQCLANLSITLASFGPLVQTETSGSSGALTLLPTAGALIGAPTKELWVVYKLMPIAGVLSMLLSLGGNIVPTDASDYELNSAALSYGGMIATHTDDQEAEEMEEHHSSLFGAQAFAAKVEARSRDMRGGTKYIRVWYGIIMQCLWLGVLLGTCWFTQSGSIIVWWCKVRQDSHAQLNASDARYSLGGGCSFGISCWRPLQYSKTSPVCRSLDNGLYASLEPHGLESATMLPSSGTHLACHRCPAQFKIRLLRKERRARTVLQFEHTRMYP